MDNNRTLKTSTNESLLTWSFTPGSVLIISPIAIILNGYFLVIFAINKNLRTPFNVYLGNLLLTNLLYSVLNNPLDIVNNVYPTWPLSNTACNVYTYSLSALGAMTIHSHALISINRLLAVTFPVFFKNHHNCRAASFAVIVLWGYVHVICLPGIVQDALFYRLPYTEHRCMLNGAAQYEWNMVVQFTVYVMPVSMILLTYPYLLFKQKERQRVRFSTRQLFSAVSSRHGAAVHVSEENVGKAGTNSTAAIRRLSSLHDDRHRAFVITTMLTLSILVCWAPNVTFYTVASFVNVDSPLGYHVMALLFALQSVMDPILFALALKDLRSALLAPVPKFAFCSTG